MSRDTAAAGTRWLAQATDDLETARLLLANDRHAVACFHAQQSAEKAPKGLLYAEGADGVFSHSASALCGEVAVIHPELAPRCPQWASLDQYDIPTRYPDAPFPAASPAMCTPLPSGRFDRSRRGGDRRRRRTVAPLISTPSV